MTALARARDFIARYSNLSVGVISPGWSRMGNEIKDAIVAGDLPCLVALDDALAECPEPPFHLVKDDVFHGLALVRTGDALRAFLARVAGPPRGFHARSSPAHASLMRRSYGALLGYGQDDEGLVTALRAFGDDPAFADVLACFIQERLLRGGSPSAFAEVRSFWASRVRDDEGLGALPLTPLSFETDLLVTPRARTDTIGNWFSFGHGNDPEATPGRGVSDPGLCDEVPLDDEERARWTGVMSRHQGLRYPNSEVEARLFTRHGGASGVAPSVGSLPLACLEGAEPNTLEECAMTPQNAFGLLFRVATQTGAYGVGASAAYGRLYAWQALGGLCGVGAEASLEEKARVAARSTFTSFSAGGSWFNRVCIDFGLACLRADGRTLAAVAGTDTD